LIGTNLIDVLQRFMIAIEIFDSIP